MAYLEAEWTKVDFCFKISIMDVRILSSFAKIVKETLQLYRTLANCAHVTFYTKVRVTSKQNKSNSLHISFA